MLFALAIIREFIHSIIFSLSIVHETFEHVRRCVHKQSQHCSQDEMHKRKIVVPLIFQKEVAYLTMQVCKLQVCDDQSTCVFNVHLEFRKLFANANS